MKNLNFLVTTIPVSLIVFCLGCTPPPPAPPPVYGCMDSTATNYNPLATVDDGSCTFMPSFTNGSITDVDGNTYTTVIICGYEIMTENLRVTHYNDGTLIPELQTNFLWSNDTDGAWCYYNNDSSFNAVYGKLYSHWALGHSGGSFPNFAENLCPIGWHKMSFYDWYDLMVCLGFTQTNFGGVLKSLTYWNAPNTAATNSFGFNGLPGGHRDYTGDFEDMGSIAFYCSSTNDGGGWGVNSGLVAFFSSNDNISIGGEPTTSQKTEGVSCRCVKDY